MNNPLFDLSGNVAIVTGGATGIGSGISQALAAAGANIVICGRRLERCENVCAKISELGVDAIPYRCDVSIQEDVERVMEEVIKRYDRIDILVNNAGIPGSAKPVLEIDLQEWRETLSINLTGAFLCSQAAARHMKKQGKGKIINIASVGSFKPLPCSADYSASKGGMLMLTRVTALELIRHGINVNAICPGYIDTEFEADAINNVSGKFETKIPAGRLGGTDDIGGAAVFLASSASDYMVGASVVVDGGVMLK